MSEARKELQDGIALVDETIAYVKTLPKDLRVVLWTEDLLVQKKNLVFKLYLEVTHELKELTRIHYR